MPRGGFRENAGRKPGWRHPETQVIRVPKVYAPKLLEIAKKLDNEEPLDFVTESKEYISDLTRESIRSLLSKWRCLSNSTTPKNTRWDKARQLLDELETVIHSDVVLDSVTKSEPHPDQMSLLDFNFSEMVGEPAKDEDPEAMEQTEDFTLAISDLGRRWKQKTPAISRAKKTKTREEFIEYSKGKEPKGFGWEYLASINRFRPVDISQEDLQDLKDFYQADSNKILN